MRASVRVVMSERIRVPCGVSERKKGSESEGECKCKGGSECQCKGE